MELQNLEHALEAILFAAGDPVPVVRLAEVLELPVFDVETALKRLADSYLFDRRGIRIIRLETTYQMCSDPQYAPEIRGVLETRRAGQLSPALLEVLSIVAYRQPVTRAYIEQVRGVDSTYSVAALAEKSLIEEAGRLDVPGRPILYRTTADFLRVFGLSSLEDLPPLPEFDDPDSAEQLSFSEEAEVVPT